MIHIKSKKVNSLATLIDLENRTRKVIYNEEQTRIFLRKKALCKD